jgi:peptidyl-prolyl cis-trans isomerase C
MLRLIGIVLMVLVLDSGCSSSDRERHVLELPTDGQPVLTVNGLAVPKRLLDGVARQSHLQLSDPAQRAQAIERLIELVLTAQAAEQQGLFDRPEFRADVEAMRLLGVFQATIAEFERATPISEATLRAEYAAEAARAGNVEYDFTQLLFADESDALAAEAEVLAGTPFTEVFEHWRGKAKQARSFHRVRRDQVPQVLAEALAALRNGETSQTPVRTEYGWHVLHLDIANSFTPPSFDEVKEGIRRSLQAKAVEQRLRSLREQARVEYPAGLGTPHPAVDASR